MQKIFDGNYRLPTGISSGFLSIKKQKGSFNIFLPPVTSIAYLRNVHPWVKSLFSARIVPNLPLAGKLKHFLEEWKILTKYPEILEILKNPTQESFPDATYGPGANSSNTSGNREHVEQGSHRANRESGWGFFKQYFRPVVNLRYINQFIPYQHFKMKGLFCLRELLQGDYTRASWIWKMLIFQFHRISHEGTMFGFMVWESLWVPLLMFRLGTSSQNFHKIAENTNVCTEEDKYSDSNIFGRYSYNGSNNESLMTRHCNLPPATFGFCFKPGEVHFESSSGNRVPWSNNKFFEDVSVFTTRGIKNSESMSGHSFQRSRDSSCYLIFSQNILTIWTEASKGSWGAVCQGIPTGGEWNLKEQQLHINVLEITQ